MIKKIIPHFSLGLSLIVLLFSFQAEAKKDQFKFNGRLGVGFQRNPEDDFQNDFELRLQANSPRKEGFKGVIEFKGDEGSRNIDVQDAYIDYRNKEKNERVRFGRGKKILGWEWEYPSSARITLKRTAVYDFMNERALTGRDYFVSYVKVVKAPEPPATEEDEETTEDLQTLTDSSYFDPEKVINPEELWKYEFAIHLNEADDVAFIASAIRTFSPEWKVGGWLLGQRSQTVGKIIGVWEATLSALYKPGIHRAELELFTGTDPYRSEINRLYGNSKIVQFMSAKAVYGVYLNRFNPYTSGDVIWKDQSQLGNHALQGILGLRYFLAEGLSVAGEGSLTANFAKNDPTAPSYHETGFRMLARYFF